MSSVKSDPKTSQNAQHVSLERWVNDQQRQWKWHEDLLQSTTSRKTRSSLVKKPQAINASVLILVDSVHLKARQLVKKNVAAAHCSSTSQVATFTFSTKSACQHLTQSRLRLLLNKQLLTSAFEWWSVTLIMQFSNLKPSLKNLPSWSKKLISPELALLIKRVLLWVISFG